MHLAVAVGWVQYERTLASACMCMFSTPGVIIWKAIFSDIFYLNKSRPSISYLSPVTAEGQGPSLTQRPTRIPHSSLPWVPHLALSLGIPLPPSPIESFLFLSFWNLPFMNFTINHYGKQWRWGQEFTEESLMEECYKDQNFPDLRAMAPSSHHLCQESLESTLSFWSPC